MPPKEICRLLLFFSFSFNTRFSSFLSSLSQQTLVNGDISTGSYQPSRPFTCVLCLRLKGANEFEGDGVVRINLDDPVPKHRQPLLPWQKRRRRPRPRDHRISPVNDPLARILPTDRREQPSYEERRRQLLGSYAEAHARAIEQLPSDQGAENDFPALLDEDRSGSTNSLFCSYSCHHPDENCSLFRAITSVECDVGLNLLTRAAHRC